LTLEDDVAELLEAEVHRQRKTMKEVVNEALRRGLGPDMPKSGKTFRVRPHKTKFRPGLDHNAFNRLVDELEDEAVLGTVGGER